jgi:acetyl esterase
MPVDTATRSFLDMIMASGGKPLNELPVSEVREAVRALSIQLACPKTEVQRVDDRRIHLGAHDIHVRIYFPRAVVGDERLPIVMHYHGGGYVAGDLDSHDSIARYYCKHSDAIVVSVDYRLAPEHKFPAAVDDSWEALRWAVDHAQEIGGNPARVAVTGDSAGGTLSAVLCQLAAVQGSPRIAFQALLYPGADFRPAASFPSRSQFGGGDYFLSNADLEWFAAMYLSDRAQDASDPRASPIISRDLSRLPPALVVTAGCDLLRDEGKAYADSLAAAGVPVEYRCFEDTIHAFVSFSGHIPAGTEALALVASRLRHALHAS